MPGFHAGRPPHNKGLRYPADPPTIEEIIAVMRAAGDGAHGRRLRALIVILWRAGLRIQEALALTEGDLDHRRGAVLVRSGKGGRRREVGMDAWAWDELLPWLELRVALSVGPLLCVINGSTRGRAWSSAAARGRGVAPATVASVRTGAGTAVARFVLGPERARAAASRAKQQRASCSSVKRR
jgi:integrase